MSAPLAARPRRAGSGPRFGSLASTAMVVALSVVAASCTSDPPPPPPPPPPISVQVVHDGTTTAVRVRTGRTVGDALEKARVEAVEGQLLSAATKEPLRPNGNEATYEIDGVETSLAEELTDPVTIEVVDGEDTTEPTEVVQRPQVPEGLPNALQYVQFAGKAGLEEVTVGTESGEVVTQRTITPSVPAHRATGKVLALTFDDGPNPSYTPKVLEILEEKGVPATFCQVGSQVRAHPELVQQVLDGGHQLCNHTLSHVEDLETQPRAKVESEMGGGREAIVDVAGEAPPFYRPPGGSLGPVIYEIAEAQDEVVLYWSIDPRDWQKPPPEEIVKNVVNQLEPGGIILLHDGGGDRAGTLAALPGIIDYARALGYTFVAPISSRSQIG